jgi:hypothetical protein
MLSHLTRAANRLDRHRNAMFVVVSASWITLAALTFALRSAATRARGIALAAAIVLILVEQWVLFLWSWFRESNAGIGGSGGQATSTIRAILLLAFGVIVILVSWKMTTFFARP